MLHHPLHQAGRHHVRFKQIPSGYRKHSGRKCPFDHPDQVYVDVVIRTAQGYGFSGPHRATMHDWNHDNHPDGIGAVVAYRVLNKD